MPEDYISVDTSFAERLFAAQQVNKINARASEISALAISAYHEALIKGKISGAIYTYNHNQYIVFGSSKSFFETNWNAISKAADAWLEDRGFVAETVWIFTDTSPIPIPIKTEHFKY